MVKCLSEKDAIWLQCQMWDIFTTRRPTSPRVFWLMFSLYESLSQLEFHAVRQLKSLLRISINACIDGNRNTVRKFAVSIALWAIAEERRAKSRVSRGLANSPLHSALTDHTLAHCERLRLVSSWYVQRQRAKCAN